MEVDEHSVYGSDEAIDIDNENNKNSTAKALFNSPASSEDTFSWPWPETSTSAPMKTAETAETTKTTETIKTAETTETYCTPATKTTDFAEFDYDAIFVEAEHSPPALRDDIKLNPIELLESLRTDERMDERLINGKSQAPIWGTCNEKKRAQIAFLAIRNYYHLLKEGWDDPKKNYSEILSSAGGPVSTLLQTLDERTDVGKRLKRVMRKGGDAPSNVSVQSLETFLDLHQGWTDPETEPTIFNGGGPHVAKPLYRVQGEEFPLCYMIAPSSVAFYSNFVDKKPLDNQDHYVNAHCHVRDAFENLSSFQYIFLGLGGDDCDMLQELLAASHPLKTISRHHIETNLERIR